MSNSFEIYVFVLCFIVFAILTGVFAFLIYEIAKMSIRLIKSGAEDENIKTEYYKVKEKAARTKLWVVIDRVLTALLCALIFAFFGFSMCVNIEDTKVTGNMPTIQIVNSASMASKNEHNKYLFTNNLNDQFQTFDLIVTHALPKEEELQLYDIVVYEADNLLIIHRIVAIEEPNERHSERYFLLQGDAVESPDMFPVRYSQMKGIYKGQRIPFIGSFVAFMQSPAGYLCIILTVATFILSPLLDNKMEKVKKERLVEIGVIEAQLSEKDGAQVSPDVEIAQLQRISYVLVPEHEEEGETQAEEKETEQQESVQEEQKEQEKTEEKAEETSAE